VATLLENLPLLDVEFVTGTNEDWLDSILWTTGTEENRPIDISGIEFRSEIRSDPDNALIILSLATNRRFSGTLRNGGTLGILSWHVPKPRVRFINPDIYVFDVLGMADGLERRVAKGTVTFERGITRGLVTS
jgi:hypothetical protein